MTKKILKTKDKAPVGRPRMNKVLKMMYLDKDIAEALSMIGNQSQFVNDALAKNITIKKILKSFRHERVI